MGFFSDTEVWIDAVASFFSYCMISPQGFAFLPPPTNHSNNSMMPEDQLGSSPNSVPSVSQQLSEEDYVDVLRYLEEQLQEDLRREGRNIDAHAHAHEVLRTKVSRSVLST